MAKKRGSAVAVVVLLVGLAFSGCSAVKSGSEATIGYIRGEYIQYTAKKVSAVCSASVGALDQLKVTISEQACDELTGRIVARNAQDAKITIKISRTGENLTRVAIQIGALGDKRQSQAIFNMILKRL